ncbi:MAG: hypothetical protein K2N48_08615 [Muribaculaceae bacterium]|nr:hypothetical protein [Muribaculaceae bacterium]
MKYVNIILGEYDDFLQGREACIEPVEKQQSIMNNVPEKFQDDIKALTNYIGENKFKRGLNIELSLSELLKAVPRKRRRADAYNSLIAYLNDELNITLTLKNSKK